MTASASRPRPARRALDELSLPVEASLVDRVSAGEPDWLTADRRAAFEAFERLPGESNLLYTPYIDLRLAQLDGAKVVSEAFRSDRRVGALPADADADALIEIDDTGAVVVALSKAAADALLVVGPLREALDAVGDALTSADSIAGDDKFAQLTRALWSDGVLVDVPAGTTLAKPIVVRWSLGAPHQARFSRTIIRLGDGASASLVEEFVPSPDADPDAGQSLFAGTMEVVLGANASLGVASLQELPANIVGFQHRNAQIGEAASLRWALAQLGGRLIRTRVDNRLVGDRSSVQQVEIVFGSDQQLFDLTSYTTHIGKNTTGDLLSKAALLEGSRTFLKGLITIERSANGTDSFLGEFGMNLSKQARSVAIPSLEIEQPDCRRAAHSSSVGPIDETQLFYLESRGIPPDEARKFIVLGFLEPVVARVPLASAQDRLRQLLEAKWIAGTDGVTGEAAA
ncbi:MAG TPA: SufD family Fe-S cluster assembly protein [Candidatus Limnocylindrales bacterium]|nr:SufD family Fe-S cluster assembly protein [Candidatus Limnocylindrales bacterium]